MMAWESIEGMVLHRIGVKLTEREKHEIVDAIKDAHLFGTGILTRGISATGRMERLDPSEVEIHQK